MKGLLIVLGIIFLSNVSFATDSICATVKLKIVQEVTFTRQGFDAKMIIHNGLSNELENLNISLNITDEDGIPINEELFFVKISSKNNIIGDINGSGIINGNSDAEIHWLIIPSIDAGGEIGKRYYIGANLSYSLSNSKKDIVVASDSILVKPQPLLKLDYFQPKYVYGDDPFTDETETPIPYNLGVRVKNIGFGNVNNLKISSAQPEIVENKLNLLINFSIISTEIAGVISENSLNIDFGNISAGNAKNANWLLISTLYGEFIEFDIDFSHSEELGGQQTSLISDITPHFLIGNVINDLPGRDLLIDFLAFEGTDTSGEIRLYESDSQELNVLNIDNFNISGILSSTSKIIEIDFVKPNKDINPLIYLKTNDLSKGNYTISKVVRSDGKILNSKNIWINKVYNLELKNYEYYINLFDTFSTGRYKIYYNTSEILDVTPPNTRLFIRAPNKKHHNNSVAVKSESEILFLANDDINPIYDMKFMVRGINSEFNSVINPFNFNRINNIVDGLYYIDYYSIDSEANEESVKSQLFILDNTPPSISSFSMINTVIYPNSPKNEHQDKLKLDILLRVLDLSPKLDLILQVSNSNTFTNILFSKNIEIDSNKDNLLYWYGVNNQGDILPEGSYYLRLLINDALNEVIYSDIKTIDIKSWINDKPVSKTNSNQLNPDIYMNSIVWQDDRNDRWDIFYFKDNLEKCLSCSIVNSDNVTPKISNNYIVWKNLIDEKIYIYNLSTSGLEIISNLGILSDFQLYNNHIVYHKSEAISDNIYLYDISEKTIEIITINERNQNYSDISENYITWLDERHGHTEVYVKNLSNNEISRLSNISNEKLTPKIVSDGVVYISNKTLYKASFLGDSSRISSGNFDKMHLTSDEENFVYSENYNGSFNVLWGNIRDNSSNLLIDNDHNQIKPSISGENVVWQDDRSGLWQIRRTDISVPKLIIKLMTGLNVVPLPMELYPEDGSAISLLMQLNLSNDVINLMQLNPETGFYNEVEYVNGVIEGDFALRPSEGIILKTTSDSSIVIEDTISVEVDLYEGLNIIGVENIPYGLLASELIEIISPEKVDLIRVYSIEDGTFHSVSIKYLDGDWELEGDDFMLKKEEAIFITLNENVDDFSF